MRRFLLAAAVALLALTAPALAAHTGKTIGAIRWDPWYIATDTDERPPVEASLGPSYYQGRAPACATVVNTFTISFGSCSTQAQIDSEITAAHNAGLDYFAYVWYGANDVMQTAWRFHQSSALKNNMKWSAIYAYSFFVSQITNNLSANVGYLQQSNYQTVLSGQPIVYLLNDGTTTNASLASAITSLRNAMSSAGAGNPYIVLMSQSTAGTLTATGADAIADYQYAPPTSAGAHTALASATQARWNTLYATGQKTIPTVTTGWDRRPRIENPMPFEAQQPWAGWLNYYAAGTPAQIASDVTAMLTWMGANTAADPAQTGLIYSWDEHDEGGSTLNPTLGGGNAILTAVAGVL